MTQTWEYEYNNLVRKILENGERRESRSNAAISIFGEKLVVDMQEGFPLLTGRKMYPEPIIGELAAMLRGPKNIKDFNDQGCNYWNEFASAQGELELDYGNSWIDFNGVNQLETLVETLKTNPLDRRMIVSGWRPDRLKNLSLPSCHILYQWYVRDGKYLDMIWYQRSVDTMIGLPADIVLAAVWNMLLANECGFEVGKITMMLGDTHIYTNHLDGAIQYLKQNNDSYRYSAPCEPLGEIPKELAKIVGILDTKATVFNFEPSMLKICNYKSKPAIKFKLNV